MMRLEFWVAGRLGRAWLRVAPGLRARFSDMPAVCEAIAGGGEVPARSTWEAQDFAWRVWARSGMAVMLLAFPIIAVTAALHPSQSGARWSAAVVAVLASFFVMGLVQMALLTYRAFCTGSYLREHGPEADGVPLPARAWGRPNRYDFWVALAPAVIFCAILLHAGFK